MARKPVSRAATTARLGRKIATRGASLASDTAEVIGTRMTIAASTPASVADGARATAEAARLVPEKVAAFAEGGLAGGAAAGRLAQVAFAFAAGEVRHAGHAMASIAGARGPIALAGAQTSYALGLAGRLAEASIMLANATLQMQLSAMAPVARAAGMNARRLRGG